MRRRSPGSRAQPTRRQQRRIVVLKALSALAVLVLARASTLIAGSETPAPQDSPDAFASAETRVAVPAGSDPACFPVTMDVGTDGVEEHDAPRSGVGREKTSDLVVEEGQACRAQAKGIRGQVQSAAFDGSCELSRPIAATA